MGHQSLYVCYSINDIFAREAGISLIGMLENNPDYEPDEVFFLDYGIHPVNKQRLGEIAARYGKHVTFLNAKAVTDSVRQLFPKLKGWRGSMAPNAKAFVDQIIPDYVGRLLFIDADTLVSGSLAELRTLDMSEAVLGVVPSNTTKDEFRKKKIELANGTLNDYIGNEVAVCATRGISFIDIYFGVINVDTRDRYLSDDYHINEEGAKAVAVRFVKLIPLN